MLRQRIMIEKIREACEQDDRLVSALMYGSFAQGEGDEFSDIEFYLFFRDEAAQEVDQQAWVSQIAPVDLYYVNEFVNGTAIFENLARGEFHFEKVSDRRMVDAWEVLWFPSLSPGRVVVLDNLAAHKGERVRELIEGRGCELLFLPPYSSPDFSPIEEAFSKLKALLRRAAARTRGALVEAIGRALDAVTARDARGCSPTAATR